MFESTYQNLAEIKSKNNRHKKKSKTVTFNSDR